MGIRHLGSHGVTALASVLRPRYDFMTTSFLSNSEREGGGEVLYITASE